MRRPANLVIVALAAFVLPIAAVACSDDSSKSKSAAGSATVAPSVAARDTGNGGVQVTTTATNQAQAMSTPELVERVRPSVVRVHASGTGAFGQSNGGTGTGFIIDERGYIVTNNHVVTLGGDRPATNLQVDLADGRTLDAKLQGRDPSTDLAVLKVDAGGLKPVQFADPRSVVVGEDVVAVGFALDLGATPTVTKGVVSALDRVIEERTESGAAVSISGAIQTDAAINPGNSGGPLLNARGEVIGINTAGLFGGEGRPVQGISFAVSAQVAQPIVRVLIDSGVVRRGYLGVVPSTVDREVARARRLAVNEGALLARVDAGPAERAGLRLGDVIVKIGDVEIKNVGDITLALTRSGPGQKVKVEYYRGSERRTTEVTPSERPPEVR
jgi:S1-C subfamily serine protease